MVVFLVGIAIPCDEVCSDNAVQITASTPKHPPEPLSYPRYVPAKCRKNILLHCLPTQRKRLPPGDVKFLLGLVADISLFVVCKVGAMLAPSETESLKALTITDLKNICNFRLCSISCRKSNYMMSAGNRYLFCDFTSITKEMLNLKYTEDF